MAVDMGRLSPADFTYSERTKIQFSEQEFSFLSMETTAEFDWKFYSPAVFRFLCLLSIHFLSFTCHCLSRYSFCLIAPHDSVISRVCMLKSESEYLPNSLWFLIIKSCYCIFLRRIQALDDINYDDYMLLVRGYEILFEVSSSTNPGSLHNMPHDDRFMIKTLKKSEVKVMMSILHLSRAHKSLLVSLKVF